QKEIITTTMCLCAFTLFGVEAGETKSLSVMEGDSVTLHIDVTDIQGSDAVIEWMFGAENPDIVIAEINRAANISHVTDEIFRDRVKMDSQTGSLTITNIRTTDSGLYQVEITTNKEAEKTFNVTVYALLPVPVIIRNTSQCSSSSGSSSVSKCSLLCSVLNVNHVTLSWYKGNSVISSISASDLSISLSLPLEVEHQDKNTYSCVLNNNISNQTKHLDISQLCQPCAGTSEMILVLYTELTAATYGSQTT
uniref:Ig-like domain-containing protein n=1 Tax=Sinocyclocheilus rhinocerous TaxID=307959 RepID=A0A673IRF7_9TELE